MSEAAAGKVVILIMLAIALWGLSTSIHKPHPMSQPLEPQETSKENKPMAGSDNQAPQVLRVPQDYTQIQAAIDAAPEGSTIFIGPGVYRERLVIRKSLTLLGEGAEQTVIDGSAVAASSKEKLALLVTLRIGGSLSEPGGRPLEVSIGRIAIIASQEKPPSSSNTINLNHAIYIASPTQVTLWSSQISGAFGVSMDSGTRLASWQNQISSSIVGISTGPGEPSTIFSDGDIIRPPGHHQGTGIKLSNTQAILSHATIEDTGVGILIVAGSQVKIERSTIQRNEVGIAVGGTMGGDASLDMSLSQVINNQTYGVALIQPPCFPNLLPEPEPGIPPPPPPSIQVFGGGNTITGNGKADFCPAYPGPPWPPLFVK